jgi:predicted RNase H-like HicB family nuclease
MNEYLVVYENAGPNWSAYVPDLPGCIGTGDTFETCKQDIQAAIEAYLETATKLSRPVPPPSTRGEYLKVG